MKLSSKQNLDLILGNLLIAINAVFARAIGWIIRRDHSLKKHPSTVIITKMLGLGSLLMASDAILAIKKRYPSAKIILICSISLEKEAATLGLFDHVWSIDDTSFIHLISSVIDVLLKTWKLKNKWTVNLEVYSRLSTIFSLWTLARNRFGFNFNEVRFRYILNTHHVFFNQMILANNNYEQMAVTLDAPVHEHYVFPISEPKQTKPIKFIAINNNCSELAKERVIPESTLLELIIKLCDEFDYNIALIGSKVDMSYNEKIKNNLVLKQYQNRIFNFAGNYPFKEFLEFLKFECKLLITIDSGPLHFAYRLNMLVVSVWGPTHPATRIPKSFQHQHIFLGVPCSPCVHHTDILPCGGNNFCMKNISANDIFEAVKFTLD